MTSNNFQNEEYVFGCSSRVGSILGPYVWENLRDASVMKESLKSRHILVCNEDRALPIQLLTARLGMECLQGVLFFGTLCSDPWLTQISFLAVSGY